MRGPTSTVIIEPRSGQVPHRTELGAALTSRMSEGRTSGCPLLVKFSRTRGSPRGVIRTPLRIGLGAKSFKLSLLQYNAASG